MELEVRDVEFMLATVGFGEQHVAEIEESSEKDKTDGYTKGQSDCNFGLKPSFKNA